MAELLTANDMPLVLPVRVPVFTPQLPGRDEPRLERLEIPFSGAWIPDEDALKIGLANFADLQNLRYTNAGLEGVQGYTRLTTTALTARPALRSSLQFVKVIGGTATSFLLVQAYTADLATAAVYQHTALIPAAGNFTATALWTDSSGGGLGRFALGPDGTIAYTNGVDSTLWGSSEHRLAAAVNYDDPGSTFRYDVTERLANTLTNSANLVTLVRDASSDIWLLIGATRPLQGIMFSVQTANAGASTSTVEYWSGSAWTAVSSFVDGTASGGVTLAQTGSMTFTSTVSTARVKFEDERLLYFYRVKVGATGTPDATIVLSHLTVDAPMQAIVDVWDGVERTPIQCQVNNKDYTLDVLETSSSSAPIAANLNGVTTAQRVLIGFEERITALQLRLIPDAVNAAATVLTLKYWNGTAWTTVTTTDGTASGGVSLAQSGAVAWNAPAATSEFRQTLFGRTGYFYELSWNANLSATDILIDTVSGIPAQRWNAQDPVPGYLFPFSFAGRLMLAGLKGTNELNRIDYCAVERPDVWNGEQASDQGKGIYMGEHHPLTSAIEMTNRYAGNLTALAVVTKADETWILQGNSPENFTRFRVSDVVGNPAPLSLTLADIPSTAEAQALRNVALWCSAKGPVMFDGTVLLPMRFPQPDGQISSIDAYFTPTDSRYINTERWEQVRGWYDAQFSEYNLLLPSGAGQALCNVWLVCDLRRRKWFRKVPTTYPQMAVIVKDRRGTPYAYGGLDSGHLCRLEQGLLWDTDAIAHQIDTADLLPSGSAWDTTHIRYLKTAAVAETGTAVNLVVAHAVNGSGSFATELTLPLVASGSRYVKQTEPTDLVAWSHQFRLTCSTTDKQRAPRLLGVALQWHIEREDLP